MTSEENKKISEIKELLYNSEYAVFFGGAGVSTESGIPDFRGSGGLYSDSDNEYYLSRTCLTEEPEKFFEFYRTKMLYPDAKPNKTHIALAELEKAGIIKAVVTQNIDGLHQAAGSRNVFELHGTVSRNYCMKCKREYSAEYIINADGVPKCSLCGGIVRPDVTLYEEPLPTDAYFGAKEHINKADLLIVGGSSLTVFPASGFVVDFTGEHLVIINLTPTGYDVLAEHIVNAPLSQVFEKLI